MDRKYNNCNRFKGKTAIVTGSAKGIGRQVAIDFAQEGANVVITDIDDEGMREVSSTIQKNDGVSVAETCNVAKSLEVERLVNKVIKRFGAIDILVNNAGLLLTGSIEETTDDVIDRTLDINVKGVLYFIRAVTPFMKRRNYGKILNLSSIAGKNGDHSTIFAYGASKGAVISITKSVARQLGPYNINVNAVAPHAVMTHMMDYWTDKKKEEVASLIPLHRLATPKDISSVILFLSSDDATFITGETININGGYYMD